MRDWLIFGAIMLALMGGVVWYMIGWRNRMLRTPAQAQEETSDEGKTSGRLIDPKLAKFIGTHVWGRSERRRFIPGEYEGPISCLTCGQGILPGQFFWETPLLDPKDGIPTGHSFQICLSCQPGDVEAVIQGA